jgi:hypothetical protein
LHGRRYDAGIEAVNQALELFYEADDQWNVGPAASTTWVPYSGPRGTWKAPRPTWAARLLATGERDVAIESLRSALEIYKRLGSPQAERVRALLG